ncbi:phage baseplate assembly protein V [Dethiosulfovibrio salsuginis]|uniref:Phage baseplate assembly protein V n=1 Tax=Dethiosulfovibrio salsuginis TaxID=561720 RepID=A0A1X7L1D4_9BACT|nr:phage baseplate assembly protein V [Dethiosulfovibrio salsuginis]SMG47641.1 phage baseplate assembly protein V [Dethiosulfovibrio salsuginis]
MRTPPSDWVLADINSRLARMMRIGTVVELDEAAARVRVTCGAGDGKITTAWLPWITARAGPDRTWWALEPGEQVMVLSPSGEMSQGVVLGSIYRDAHPAPAASKDIQRVDFDGGSYIEHDRKRKKFRLHIEGDMEISVTGHVQWTAGAEGYDFD